MVCCVRRVLLFRESGGAGLFPPCPFSVCLPSALSGGTETRRKVNGVMSWESDPDAPATCEAGSSSRSVTFIHCADLHLGSPGNGLALSERSRERNAAERLAERLRNAPSEALANLVTLALERRVDFVLFAGDVFDSEDRTLASQLDFREQVRRLAAGGIASYLVHGNHDPLSGWEARLDLPPSVHRFGPKVTSLPILREGRVVARVYGFSYPRRDVTRNVVEEFRAAAQEPESAGEGVFRIGLLHANVGGRAGHENYAPCSLDDLCAAGMDYWALGHVHEREILREREPFVAYPGTFQSRRRGETGPRGCFAVTLTPGSRHVRCEFIPVDAVRRYRHTLNLSSVETEERLLGALSELKESVRADAEGRMALLQVRFEGRTALHGALLRKNLGEEFAVHCNAGEVERDDCVWLLPPEDRTAPCVAVEELRGGDHFVGDVLRSLENMRACPDVSLLTRLLSEDPESRGWERREIRNILTSLSSGEIREIFGASEAMLLDGLLREEA